MLQFMTVGKLYQQHFRCLMFGIFFNLSLPAMMPVFPSIRPPPDRGVPNNRPSDCAMSSKVLPSSLFGFCRVKKLSRWLPDLGGISLTIRPAHWVAIHVPSTTAPRWQKPQLQRGCAGSTTARNEGKFAHDMTRKTRGVKRRVDP